MVATRGSVTGSVSRVRTVGGRVSVGASVVGTIDRSAIAGRLPWYEGPYDAVPTALGLTLATANRSMRQDVDVEPIPVTSTSNEAGGRTVSIG